MKPPELWYKNAIIYSLNVKTFKDSNGDGIGDFLGLTGCLDYLLSLGVNCIWLLPFFPSPDRDYGYDVQDYLNVDSRLGSLGDFSDFMYQAEQRGIRIIIDLSTWSSITLPLSIPGFRRLVPVKTHPTVITISGKKIYPKNQT